MSDEAKERKAKKVGRQKVEQRDAAAHEVGRYRQARDAEQPALFELVAAGEPLPDDDKPAGPGRPVGARAAVPQEYRRYILSTKGDFLARFAGLAQVDTFELAKLLGCTPAQAIHLQLDMAKLAAPYIYQQQPRAEAEQAAEYFAGLLFVAGAQAATGSAGTGGKSMLEAVSSLAGRPLDMQQIQALSAPEFAVSEPAHSEPVSDEEDKAP